MKFSNKLIITMVVAFSLAACSPQKTSEEYLQSAQQSIVANDDASAIIDIKNAIRINRESVEARFLLGELYLRQGEAASAEKELQRSMDLGKNIELVLPKLLKSLNLQDKMSDIIPMIELHKNGQVEFMPQVLLYAGMANIDSGDKAAAKMAFMKANEISPESIYSKLGSAYLKVASQNIDEALFKIEEIVIEDSSISEAYLLKGNLLHSKKDYTNAVKAFQQYHKLLPKNLKVRMFLARDLIQDKQFSEATKHLDYLVKLFPEQPYVNQLKGIIAFKEGNYQSSLDFTEKAMRKGIDSSPNRIVAGVSAFNLQRYELAHQYLLNVADQLRDNHPVKKILAIVQMQLGYTDDASNILGDIEVLSVEDTNLLTTASYELLKSGKLDDAKLLLGKTQLIPGIDAQGMIRVGILQLSMNDLDGITNLEKALEISPELPMAKMALAAAYIRNKDFEKALELAEDWKTKEPNEAEGYNLTAKVLLIHNKIDEAEVQLRQALKVKPDNTYSILYFANKHIQNNELLESLTQLDKLLESSPDHIVALIQHYRVNKLLKTPEKSLEKIKLSFERNKENLTYRITYARALYSEKKYNDVVIVLVDYEAIDKDTPPVYWLLLGDSYNRLNESGKALLVYEEWINKQPNLKQAWLNKLSMQEKLNDLSGALITVQEAVKKSPEDIQLRSLLANFYIENKKFAQAQQVIDSFKDEVKNQSFIAGMQGKIWLTQSLFDKALPSLLALYNLDPTTDNALYIVKARQAINKHKSAFDFIKQHVEKYPLDKVSTSVLADLAIEHDKSLALKIYQELLILSPDNGTYLNNIAWVLYLTGNYEQANIHITKAINILGAHPKVFDSAGLIKLKLGLNDEGIALLERALKLSPKDSEISKHLEDARKGIL
ncbi:MAG: putative PEP-CTERM system TPR-repeat lipoprotein [Psychroserpens sp.]|jgi:putative PEP-CTERM system TPR-repeat lipoprotein